MNDANTSSTAFPTPLSHLQHLLILGWKTGQSPEMKRRGNRARPTTRRGARLARERETETERKRWCFWTCSSTGAAGDVCTRRTTASSEFQARKTTSREREAERRSVTGRYALRSSAPTREERKRKRLIDRRTYHCLLNMLTSSVFLCVSQRG